MNRGEPRPTNSSAPPAAFRVGQHLFHVVESAANARVKAAAALGRGSRRDRREAGLALLEGWSLLEEAWRSGLETPEVFVLDDPKARERVAALAETLSPIGSPLFLSVPEQALRKIATTEAPQPVAATARPPASFGAAAFLESARRRGGEPALYAGLWEVADPSNLGAAARVAEGAGASALVLFGAGADPWSPKALRASMGSALRLPAPGFSADELAMFREATGAFVVAMAAREGTSIHALDLASRPALLLFGSESHGLPEEVVRSADAAAHIPLHGPTESLNVAAACAVALFEAARQRSASRARRGR